ncbi:HAMP domain-containing sensor histidine kinase [Enterococcus hirae]|nr:HAMP domain-containing sensor histidine kinase [Enterococcus hirae]
MKYFYQQMLAFLAIITLIVVVVGLSFTRLTQTALEDSNYEQLYGYAKGISQNTQEFAKKFPTMSAGEIFSFYLGQTEQLLENQHVEFHFVDDKQKVIYPSDIKETINVDKEEWKKLKDPKNTDRIRKTTNHDFTGKKIATSYIYVPSFSYSETTKSYSQFNGVLVASQPASNIEKSMRPMLNNLILSFFVSIIIALIFSYVFAQLSGKKIQRLRRATREISEGNFNLHITSRHKDEFDELAEDFNRMASSLKQYQAEVDRQEDLRRRFMSDVAHEMRTPLTTINGLLEGLAYHAISADQQEHAIQLMQNETKRLIRLVNENLDYEKILSNQITMLIRTLDATEILENIVLQMDQRAKAAGDTLTLTPHTPVKIDVDYDRFVQIMVNVIQNAIQFTQNGAIAITINRGEQETSVTVKDSGIGMSETQLNNIWDRYYKADPSRKNTKYGESGLGLPIVKQLVRLHGGTIKVKSREGAGTSFTVTFPDHPEKTSHPEKD